MRFIENGPTIPDELLDARDRGQVVFFCGSGVSVGAGLPDFFGLAEAAIRHLGAPDGSDACKVLKKAREIGNELTVTGLISADRVFDLLEREFTPDDIRGAVATCLAPRPDADLSAHRTLLRLARTPESRTQLVTTNFDRLFEKCGAKLATYQHPRLPGLSRHEILDGIVYLHGRVTNDYVGADGDGFVLSSSDFGYAYLSEGWATQFFRDVVRRYSVVFIGYSADDPPIHYLLEGFHRVGESTHGIYALQSEASEEVVKRWQYKGVEAIPYSGENGHSTLWKTLEQWAQRADDPDAWRRTAIHLAMDGPERLQPYQRGQLAHIVSTYEGVREFAGQKPPAEWLCVFDPQCRYGNPGRSDWSNSDSSVIDPFVLYGLDRDETPERTGEDNANRTRTTPADAWDAFAVNTLDRQDSSNRDSASLRGYYAGRVPQLPKRLDCLAKWIADVANQPAAVWWAARQKSLHPGIQSGIEWAIRHLHEKTITPAVLKSWRYLLEARRHIDESEREFLGKWYELKSEIDREGWSVAAIRQFTTITRPYVTADPALLSEPAPPTGDSELRLSDLVRLQVECPVPPDGADIPDEWLDPVIRGLRKNLELAVQLHEELEERLWIHTSPIILDDRPDIDHFQREHGLSGCVIQFASLFERLAKTDATKARSEYAAWPTNDDTVFCWLRLWAGGNLKLATPHAFCQVVRHLSDDAFWDSYHQRDLLLALAERWKELSKRSRKQLENRLLAGPAKRDTNEDPSYQERSAWHTLQCLRWLADNGCEFSFDVEQEITRLRSVSPKWEPECAKHAADSLEMRGGWVSTNTEHAALLCEPITSILPRALTLSGRAEDDALEERDPFAGLCVERPIRAIRGLNHAARKNDYPDWAWRKFLHSAGREKDKPRLSALVAERLSRIPDEAFVRLLPPTTSWLKKVTKSLSKHYPNSFDRVTSRLIDVLSIEPSSGRSNIAGTDRGRDWVMEAINSPAGQLAETIFSDSRLEAINDPIDPSATWLRQLASLLALNDDPRRHAITIVSRRLGWLHRIAADWADRNILSILDAGDEEDRESFWDGFLSNPHVRSPALYLRLKPGLLALAQRRGSPRDAHLQSLAEILLSGWITRNGDSAERLISNNEFRDSLLHGGDGLRSHTLWQIERRLRNKQQNSRNDWSPLTLELLQDVWPRQRVVKNPTMSARLCELLISSTDTFSALVDTVLPLLTRITRDIGLHFYLQSGRNNIIKAHPQRLLTLLYAILPDEVTDWPYGIWDTLEQIVAVENSLLSDAQFRELRRRWNSR